MSERGQVRLARPVKVWKEIIAIVIGLTLAISLSVLYTNRVDARRAADERQNDREWCELIVTFDDAYKANPPPTDTGRRVAQMMDRRRQSLGCD